MKPKIRKISLSLLYYRLAINNRRRWWRGQAQLAPLYGKSLLTHLLALLILAVMTPEIPRSSPEIIIIDSRMDFDRSVAEEVPPPKIEPFAADRSPTDEDVEIMADVRIMSPNNNADLPETAAIEIPPLALADFIEDARENDLEAEVILSPHAAAAEIASVSQGGIRAAINRGLAYLAKTQEADGGWQPLKYEGRGNQIAVTALAMLAFAKDPEPRRDRRYQEIIQNARQFLTAQFVAANPPVGAAADWGLPLWAIAAAAKNRGEWRRETLAPQLLTSVIGAQNPDGGWSDQYSRGGNLIASALVIGALAETRRVGARLDDSLLAAIEKYLQRVSPAEKYSRRRLGVYREGGEAVWQQSVATAAAFGAWMQFAELTRAKAAENSKARNYARELSETLNSKRWWFGGAELSFFAAYFQALGLGAIGGQYYDTLAAKIAPAIISAQETAGFNDGSWIGAPEAAAFELSLGRIGATALAILTLESALIK